MRTTDRIRWLTVAAGLVTSGCAVAPAPVESATEAITHGWDDDGDDAVVALIRARALMCSGVLVAPDAVLTAGHCVDLVMPDAVVFGAFPGRPTRRVTVTSVHVHPDYDRTSLSHDIAVVRLAEDVDVQPTELPRRDLDEHDQGAQVRLVGFGLAEDGTTENLRKRQGFARIAVVDAGRFRIDGDPSQPCRGDSGGPTFLRMDGHEPVVGVHSGGNAECTGGSIETRVDVHREFIDRVTTRGYALSSASSPGLVSATTCAVSVVPRGDSLPAWAVALLGLFATVKLHRTRKGASS
ncbi:MAG: S1 family peptidase [Myxococcota bacterium]|nr:S1 family peptidase [Myxococcota bacterium]MDW8361788.1 S1 family peptidase [Myxococcales bacterium]